MVCRDDGRPKCWSVRDLRRQLIRYSTRYLELRGSTERKSELARLLPSQIPESLHLNLFIIFF